MTTPRDRSKHWTWPEERTIFARLGADEQRRYRAVLLARRFDLAGRPIEDPVAWSYEVDRELSKRPVGRPAAVVALALACLMALACVSPAGVSREPGARTYREVPAAVTPDDPQIHDLNRRLCAERGGAYRVVVTPEGASVRSCER